jgi:hypothetical protein
VATKKKIEQPVYGRNRTAIEQTINALDVAGRLELVDNAQLAICRSLADAVDSDPTNASLWREYRAAELALRTANAQDTDEFTTLLASLSAEVGNQTSP